MVSGFTACQRIASPSPPTAPDNSSIWVVEMVPMTVGRQRVRAMAASIRCSTRQLNAAAAPATSAMPAVAAASNSSGGSCGAASSMPITAVNTMSDTTLGLVRRQNCTQIAGWVWTVAFMGTRDFTGFDRSADLGRLEEALQVAQHALAVGP